MSRKGPAAPRKSVSPSAFPEESRRGTARAREPRFPPLPPDRAAVLSWALMLAFVVLGVLLVHHHEPWRDEADPWLMARDASLPQLVRLAGYVGTPILWFLAQVPLAKGGLPYATVGYLNLLFAAGAVALFLRHARLAWPLKALFVFSFFVSYEYAAIARSYALSMLLLFALAALHAKRFTSPLAYGTVLLLLLNTNVHSLALGVPILARWVWESARASRPARIAPLLGALIGAAGLALALLQLRQPPDGQLTGLVESMRLRLIPTTLAGALVPGVEGSSWAWALAEVVVGAGVIWLLRRPRALAVMLASFALLWAIFLLKYAGSPRHWGFFLLALVYALWTARDEEAADPAPPPEWNRKAWAAVSIAFGLSLVWSVYFAWASWTREIRDPFSASRQMARFLRDTRLVELPVAAWPSPHAQALLPYLPGKRFYDPGTRAEFTYLEWNRATVDGWSLPEDEVVRRIDEKYPPGRDVLFLANRPVPAAERAGFRTVHLAVGNVIMGDEQYVLYRRVGR